MVVKVVLHFLLILSLQLLPLSGPPPSHAQEKRALRVVFVSLSWNSEIPVRVAMAKGYFKEQGLTMEPIFLERVSEHPAEHHRCQGRDAGEVSGDDQEISQALVLGINLAKTDKRETIKAGYEAGLKGDPDIVSKSCDLYSPGLTADLSIAVDGIQFMIDEDIRSGLVDKKMTVDRVINDKILKRAQEELRAEGRLK